MKVEFIEPKPEPRGVTLILTNEEAQKLRAIIGNIGGNKAVDINQFIDELYATLTGVCEVEGKKLTLNGTFTVNNVRMMQFQTK